MKKYSFVAGLLTIQLMLFATNSWGQGKFYDGPDDPAGDIAAVREGYMTGNRVFLYFKNTTQLSDWPKVDVSKWPNTYDGVKMLDGVALLIGALVFIENDTIPVEDPDRIKMLDVQGKLDTLFFLQTNYREEMDTDPSGTVEWGLYPVFGYLNELQDYPAMSNRPESWPFGGWPDAPDFVDKHGTTEWNGRFGRGVKYANLETYFVANDAQDQEYLGPEDRVKYYPRPGRSIGDIRPNVTIQKGKPWGGIGIRVEQRGFQWNNAQTRDALFWEYNIANISDYDLTQVAFGYWVDNAIGDVIAGSGEDDEIGYFDTQIDMAYSWDIDGIGQGGFRTGTMGFAYLESPGLGYDGIDNDKDGLINERRDNDAEFIVGPTDGIADLAKFLHYYKLTEPDLREHWDADEDQDWEDGIDLNGDGIYQTNEYAGDDVGLDGVGPTELNYYGPDEGEGNHRPDRAEGRAEPNFAETDVSESDMVGLTSFLLFRVPNHTPPYTRWFRNDRSMWEMIGQPTLMESVEWTSNLIEVFASGPFPLYQGRTERISMAEIHSYDPLEGLNSPDHRAPSLFNKKNIVQVIYEKDYRWASEPKMPTLSATAGDGYVILTWDDIADTKTREPLLGNLNDFEGYKLYRTTDKKLSDPPYITDGYGDPLSIIPIFQCDIIDGRTGFATYGITETGSAYYLGDDTGIQHYYIDNEVTNGVTYYYSLIAYDYGIPDLGPGIAPTPNTINTIELDESENVRVHGQNVQIVTPHQKAAGYIPDEIIQFGNENLIGTAGVVPEILAKSQLKSDHVYKIKFKLDTVRVAPSYKYGIQYTNSGFFVFDQSAGDSLVFQETSEKYSANNLVFNDSLDVWHFNTFKELSTDVFDGLRIKLTFPFTTAEYDFAGSGWLAGNAPLLISPTVQEHQLYPWDYDIVFTASDSAYRGITNPSRVYDNTNTRLSRNDLLTNQKFDFYVLNRTFRDSLGNHPVMDLIVHDLNKNGEYDKVGDRILVGPITETGVWSGTAFAITFLDDSRLPKPDDVYRITFTRPFWATDSILFKTASYDLQLDEDDLKEKMDKIKVVPNPYVATNAMEPSVANFYLNQRRRLMFTHIPAQCTIKIFTVSGVLVDEIDVDNPVEQGIIHWDLLSKEGLDIAAGMYIYHVKSKRTGEEKIGKFAVIK
ncbi:hypothetical protein JW992_09255 [candidate division KSB1 bacterium]|nr:hypothetical protein [candidate division KSB1 bacterium]